MISRVQQFRIAVKAIMQSDPDFHPIHSTVSGISHIVSGYVQCLVGVGMKCSRDPEQQSQAHIHRGWRDLQKGIHDILPAATATGAIIIGYFLVKNDHQNM